MSNLYQEIESKIDNLDNIQDWPSKVECIKEIKLEISMEQSKLNELVGSIQTGEYTSKKIKKDLNQLLELFDSSEMLEDKIKYYQLINAKINELSKQLFGE